VGALGREPTKRREKATRRPPVLKNTRSVLIGHENSLLYLISQPLTAGRYDAFWWEWLRSERRTIMFLSQQSKALVQPDSMLPMRVCFKNSLFHANSANRVHRLLLVPRAHRGLWLSARISHE